MKEVEGDSNSGIYSDRALICDLLFLNLPLLRPFAVGRFTYSDIFRASRTSGARKTVEHGITYLKSLRSGCGPTASVEPLDPQPPTSTSGLPSTEIS